MKRFAFAVILGFLACQSGHAQPAGRPIKIGAIASLTGPLALTGQAQREDYLLAAKILYQRGSRNGRQIELILEDDASNPDTAITKANFLLGTQGVRALLGPGGLGPTVAVGGIAAQRNVPKLATSGIGLPVERDRHCLFHMMPPQSVNAEGLLAYAAEGVHAKRIAILHDSGFGQAVMNSLHELAPGYGVKFVEIQKSTWRQRTCRPSQPASRRPPRPGLRHVRVGDAVPQPAATADERGDCDANRPGRLRNRQGHGRLGRRGRCERIADAIITSDVSRWDKSVAFQAQSKRMTEACRTEDTIVPQAIDLAATTHQSRVILPMSLGSLNAGRK